jgi:hypothetical protein
LGNDLEGLQQSLEGTLKLRALLNPARTADLCVKDKVQLFALGVAREIKKKIGMRVHQACS